jgi:hypothetical protein
VIGLGLALSCSLRLVSVPPVEEGVSCPDAAPAVCALLCGCAAPVLGAAASLPLPMVWLLAVSGSAAGRHAPAAVLDLLRDETTVVSSANSIAVSTTASPATNAATSSSTPASATTNAASPVNTPVSTTVNTVDAVNTASATTWQRVRWTLANSRTLVETALTVTTVAAFTQRLRRAVPLSRPYRPYTLLLFEIPAVHLLGFEPCHSGIRAMPLWDSSHATLGSEPCHSGIRAMPQ